MNEVINSSLDVSTVASLIGVTERTIQKNVVLGKYNGVTYSDDISRGGNGGKSFMIPFASIPEPFQLKYLEEQGIFEEKATGSEYDNAPDWAREKANKIYTILEAMDKFILSRTNMSKGKALVEFVALWNREHEQQQVSRSSLLAWKKQFDEGGISALLPRYGQRSGSRQISEYLMTEFCKLLKKKLKIAECHRVLEALAAQSGEYCPSARTLQRIANDIPEAVLVALQDGRKAFYNKCQTFTRRDPESIAARQVYVGDHRKFDFFIRSPRGTWVRPWVTAWMDMRSGKLVGWMVTLNPNTETITETFANAALDPAIGLPREIYIDNGRDYCNARFAGRGFREKKETLKKERERVIPMMERLGITVHFAIPENARAKNIERVAFLNMSNWFCPYFDTYCGRNSAARPEELTGKLKSKDPTYDMTLDELKAIFDTYVSKVYNKRISQGKGRVGECPDETFERTGLPVRLVDKSVLVHFMQKRVTRYKIGRNGITLKGQEYYHPDVILYKGREVIIAQRESEPNVVQIFDLNEVPLFEAKLVVTIDAAKATKEDFAIEGKRKGAEFKRVKEHPVYKKATSGNDMKVGEIMNLLAKTGGSQAPDPTPTKVIELVPTPPELHEAIRYNKMYEQRATGTEGRPQSIFEQVAGVKVIPRKN